MRKKRRWKESIKWARILLWAWGLILSYTSFLRWIYDNPQQKILLTVLLVVVMFCIVITGYANLMPRFAKSKKGE
jgi:uncharacterized membrane protein